MKLLMLRGGKPIDTRNDMARVQILFAHPGQKHSNVNLELAKVASSTDGITFVDLYARYPRFKIDIDHEQERLVHHDVLVLQFPIYWYSTPSLLKEWQDLVLEYGFAYGPGGDKLKGKLCLPVVTAGGLEQAYCEAGSNRFGLRALLAPLEQTAGLCQMHYLPPFALFSALKARTDGRGQSHAKRYRALLEALRDDRLDLKRAAELELLSDDALPINGKA
ncbi:MAG: NAD(P)H-dependent oxidoreductase [Aestuariivirgaceae bacterium]